MNVTPFVGVWIETEQVKKVAARLSVTPFVGVWIETVLDGKQITKDRVTPFVGVWIETQVLAHFGIKPKSHPSWVCGLKLLHHPVVKVGLTSHPSWVCGLKRLNW